MQYTQANFFPGKTSCETKNDDHCIRIEDTGLQASYDGFSNVFGITACQSPFTESLC